MPRSPVPCPFVFIFQVRVRYDRLDQRQLRGRLQGDRVPDRAGRPDLHFDRQQLRHRRRKGIASSQTGKI